MAVDPWSRWTDRQRRLLEAIGVVPWPVEVDAPPGVAARDATGEVRGDPTPASPPSLATSSRPSPSPAPGALAGVPAEPARAPRVAEPVTRDRAADSAAAASVPSAGRRPVGIEQMAWEPLAAAVAGCTACKLCSGRRQTVFGTGRADAHWLVVGEAPGEQEDLQGEPFVGKSGQLLDAMLAAIGVSRDAAGAEPSAAAYIANTVKCRPPGNRNPEPEELAQCEPYLIRQIELLQPRIILAMGRFAVQSLLRSDEAIGRLRGRVHRYQGVPLVVTYHPAYLLRNPLDKARAWEDLCLAREVFSAG